MDYQGSTEAPGGSAFEPTEDLRDISPTQSWPASEAPEESQP